MVRDKNVAVKITLRDRATKGLKNFMKSLLSIRGVLRTGIGLLGLNKLLTATVGRAQSAETGLKRLSVAMQAAGRFTFENQKAFERLSVSLEKTTGFIEEDVLQALAVLQTFGSMTREDMEKTIIAATNMATVFNEDLQSSAIRLGKAYNGNLRGLQMMGIGIDAATFKAKGFQGVLDQLAIEQGGQAVARMAGFEGAVKRVSIGWGEAGKEIGKFITKNETLREILNSLAGGLTKISDFLRNKRENEDEAIISTAKHSIVISKLRDELQKLGRTHIFLDLEEEIFDANKEIERVAPLLARQEDRLNKSNKLMAAGVQIRIEDSKLYKDQQANQKLLNDLTEKYNELRKDKNLVKGFEDLLELINKQITGTKRLKSEEEDLKRLRAELAGEREVDLVALSAWYDEQKTLHKNNKDALALIDQIYLLRRNKINAEILKGVMDSNERIAQIESDALKKKMSSIERIDAIEQAATDKRVARQLDAVQAEFDARQRLAERLTSLEAEKLRKTLTDETLNWADRKEAIGEAEETAENFLAQLTNGSITSATELENVVKNVDIFKQSLSGIAETGTTLEVLEAVFKEIAKSTEILGRAVPAPKFDVDGLIKSGKTAAQIQFDAYKEELERQANTKKIRLPDIEQKIKVSESTERSSFLRA